MYNPTKILFEHIEHDIIISLDYDEYDNINKLENSKTFLRIYGEEYLNIFKSGREFLTFEHIKLNKKLNREIK